MPTAKTDMADNTLAADKPAPGDARRAGVPALKALKPKVPNLPEGAGLPAIDPPSSLSDSG